MVWHQNKVRQILGQHWRAKSWLFALKPLLSPGWNSAWFWAAGPTDTQKQGNWLCFQGCTHKTMKIYWFCHGWQEQGALHTCLWQQCTLLKTTTHSCPTHGREMGDMFSPLLRRILGLPFRESFWGWGRARPALFHLSFPSCFMFS